MANPGEDCYDELVPACGGIEISDVATRGISLKQLLDVLLFLWRRCDSSGIIRHWQHAKTNELLRFKTIDLYELNRWLIVPATARQRCSYVELVSTDAREQRPEWFISHWWGEPVAHFVFCLQEFSCQRGRRAVFWVCAYCNNQHKLTGDITIDPSRSSFGRAFRHTKGVLVVLDKAATPFRRTWCAFELATVIRSNRSPRPILDIAIFVAEDDNESDDGAAETDTSPSLIHYPDTGNTGQRRELAYSMDPDGSTPSADELESFLRVEARGAVRIISDGLLPEDENISQVDKLFGHTPAKKKALRERAFPVRAAAAGLSIAIEHAEASVQEDKQHILNFITGSSDLSGEYPLTHPAYDSVNAALRARFAMAMLRKTVEEGQAEQWRQAIAAISEDKKSLVLDFGFDHCSALTGGMLAELAENLPPQLEGLSLHCDLCTRLDDEGLAGLGRSLLRPGGASRALRRLQLDFRGCSWLGPDGMRCLGSGMKQLGNLVELKVSFEDLPCGRDGLMGIADAFPGLTSLQQLDVNFHSCDCCHSPLGSLSDFGARLGTMWRTLKVINLECSGCEWASLDGFGRGLGQLKRLQTLILSFAQCSRVKEVGLRCLAEGIGKLPQLSGMCLNLEDCGSLGGDGGLADLGESIGRLRRLTKLDLNLCGCKQLLDSNIHGFGRNLSSATRLQEMRLFFQGTGLGNVALKGLGQGLGQLRCLVRLHLDLSRCTSVGDDGLGAFSAGLGRLRRLQELSLKFFGCSFGAAGLRALGNGLGRVTSLLHLEAEFFGLFRIDDASLHSFGAGLGRLTRLTDLCLNFYRCSIGEIGLNGLGLGLSAMLNLTTLHLDFRYCCTVTDFSFMEDFGRGLGKQVSLERLQLDFGGCREITDDGVRALSDALERLRMLESLSLDFGDCFRVTDDGLQSVANAMRRRFIESNTPGAGMSRSTLELKLCFLFTAVDPEHQWIWCPQHLFRLLKTESTETLESIESVERDVEGPHGVPLLSKRSTSSTIVRRARRAQSILQDASVHLQPVPEFVAPTSDELRIRCALVPDPYAEESLVSRHLFAGNSCAHHHGRVLTCVPNLYSVSDDGHFVLNCMERNRAYKQRPDDSNIREPDLQGDNSNRKATLELKLPMIGFRFSCQLVQRVTERWGIKFAGVALVEHPGGEQYTVYLPGVLTFDPAGMTGDPHSSERVGPACDRIQVGITVTQLCILQRGGTREDLDQVDAAFDEIVALFSGRFVLAAWMRHQVEQACLRKGRAMPYPVFLRDLITRQALYVQTENRRVTREYLHSYEQGAPVVCEAYLKKVSEKDRGCFGRSCFEDMTTKNGLLELPSAWSDDDCEDLSVKSAASTWTVLRSASSGAAPMTPSAMKPYGSARVCPVAGCLQGFLSCFVGCGLSCC